MQKTIYELFDELDPKLKASFIDARLDWATNGAICGEVRIRLCEPFDSMNPKIVNDYGYTRFKKSIESRHRPLSIPED